MCMQLLLKVSPSLAATTTAKRQNNYTIYL